MFDLVFWFLILALVVCSTARDVYNRWQWLWSQEPYCCRQVRDFYVSSPEGHAKVEEFYSLLKELKEERINQDEAPKPFDLHARVTFSPYHVQTLLKSLYHQDDMWVALQSDDCDRQDVREWAYLLTTTFRQQYSKLLHSWQLCDKKERQAREATRMFHELIKYSKVIHHYDLLSTDAEFTQFIATLFEDMLHWSSTEGLLPAFLVFAHLMPDMVCDECYPVLNNDTDMYQQVVTYESVETYSRFKSLLEKYDEYIIL